MEASSTVVIKVKYGDMLRRFNAPIVDDKLFLNVDGLREKIFSLFSFAPDTDLLLSYVDEDGDVVALVDDDDLRDVVKQGLNPLRVTVKVNDDKNGNQSYSSASSTPLRSPHVPNLSAGISEILRKVPEPLRETLLKLSDDLASKASSSSPGISELVGQMSKVSLTYLGQLSESDVTLNMQNGVPESSLATDNKASEPLKVDPAATLGKPEPVASMERKEVEETNKKSKKVVANETSDGSGEKLPYVHVRSRSGFKDSFSLAERARREKINARIKLLQDLVPGCNKITGTAMVLDETINHMQALQRQVEFLSMRLATVNPRIDFNLDALLAAESESSIDNSYLGMFAPSIWPEGQINGGREHQYQQPWLFDGLQQPSVGRVDDTSNFITPENSLLSYDSGKFSFSTLKPDKNGALKWGWPEFPS